jgi:hypothetical protein
MVEHIVRLWWMQSNSNYPEEEEKAILNIVAFLNRFDGSFMH